MSDRRFSGTRPAAVFLAVVIVLGLVVAVPGTVTADSNLVDIECTAGDGGGPVYVTDSGLELEDNATAADEGYPVFPDNETVELRGINDTNVSFSAAGEAQLRLEDHKPGRTCFAAINASTHPVTITPENGTVVTVNGTVNGLAIGDGDLEDGQMDVVSNASESFMLTIHDTGLEEGDTVVTDGDATLEAEVDGDGAVTFEIPAGEVALSASVEVDDDGGSSPPPPPMPAPSPPDPAEPAAFEIHNESVDPTKLEVGEPLSVIVSIENVGDEAGTETIELLVDGSVVDETNVTLEGGEETTLEFVHAFDAEGEFDVGIETVTTVSVVAVEPPEDDDGAETSDDDEGAETSDDDDADTTSDDTADVGGGESSDDDSSDAGDGDSTEIEGETEDDDPSGVGFGTIVGFVVAIGALGGIGYVLRERL
ncbi:CARDB domain-containing protein [Natronosalvus amylolyticus]|uniref:CARDB domain-containing protein n=1 Tax=Natronosalvus amylolyticus TaxID=2961994 RepID=UPI0020CA0A6A|nr:CARDB domain-containing protein [Natronosalvus amylolyticus]